MNLWGIRSNTRIHSYVNGIPVIPLVDYSGIIPQRSSRFDRYCWECGKLVCRYKDPHLERVYCYAHDHLQEWDYKSITAGCCDAPGHPAARVDNPKAGPTTGKGHGNWKSKEGFDDIHG